MVRTKRLSVCILILAASACVSNGPPRDDNQGTVSTRDFFVYSCVSEYLKQQSIREYDGSLSFAVEYVEADAKTLARLHQAASDVAHTIPAPNYANPEHGLPSVMVICQRESKRVHGGSILPPRGLR